MTLGWLLSDERIARRVCRAGSHSLAACHADKSATELVARLGCELHMCVMLAAAKH